MSLGVNVLLKLVREAAQVRAAADFDIEIVEKHHNQKVDAPSGTAIALADSINEAMADQYVYNYDRSHERKKREKNEIGIVAVRGGTIVGQHDVIFAGADEAVSYTHLDAVSCNLRCIINHMLDDKATSDRCEDTADKDT